MQQQFNILHSKEINRIGWSTSPAEHDVLDGATRLTWIVLIMFPEKFNAWVYKKCEPEEIRKIMIIVVIFLRLDAREWNILNVARV